MNKEPSGPIINSNHHDTQPNYDNEPSNTQKPPTNKTVFIAIVVIVFMMGLGAFFFLAVSDQPKEQIVEPTEAY
jgi:hypothetical protein